MAETNDGKHPDAGFRVTDRRGSAKDEASSTAPGSSEAGRPAGSPAAPPPLDFTTFLLSLASTAMIQMGVVPHPETGQTLAEPDLARQTIDLLGLLREKTQGNLTDEESKFFDALLYDLRVHFVELTTKSRP